MKIIYTALFALLCSCSHSTDVTEMNRFHKSHERFDKLNRELEANHGR